MKNEKLKKKKKVTPRKIGWAKQLKCRATKSHSGGRIETRLETKAGLKEEKAPCNQRKTQARSITENEWFGVGVRKMGWKTFHNANCRFGDRKAF